MIVDRLTREIDHAYIRDLPELLIKGDQLVLNNSRVIPAALVGFRTQTGGKWHGLFLEADEVGNWRVIGRTRGQLSVGETITLVDRDARPSTRLKLLARLEGGQWAVRPISDEPYLSLLDRVGRVPLPHYIRDGNMVSDDVLRYQTVFADAPGSVAAPTAGLHFTNELLRQLEQRGVNLHRVTLHVGLGTFRPIAAERIEDHQMHSERGEINQAPVAALLQARAEGRRVIAVGTTSVRVLESAAAGGELRPWVGQTNLFIRPGHQFRAIDGLLTNFHLPKSTLLVLVRTFGGDELIKTAYAQAIAEQYRFFSYGDAMLIL